MDPELDSAHNPRPALPASAAEDSSAAVTGSGAEPAESAEAENTAIDSIADKILAEQPASDTPEKGLKVQSKTYKHPMAIDLLLAVGLLFAMAGLTVSFVKTYITHSAKTSILQGNYKAAIGILHGSPIPEFFGGAGTDNSEDLLNQALYLDAMEKLDNNRDDQTALQELSKVSPSQGSFYYDLAQDQFRKLKMQEHNTDPKMQNGQTIPTPAAPQSRSIAPGSIAPGATAAGSIAPGTTTAGAIAPGATAPGSTPAAAAEPAVPAPGSIPAAPEPLSPVQKPAPTDPPTAQTK